MHTMDDCSRTWVRFRVVAKLAFLFACVSFTTICNMTCEAAANETYYLGFLSPLPSSSNDSLIPWQLAQEWQSAFRVALEVLNSEDRAYHLQAVPADTGCNWMNVLALSETFHQKDLIGFVGPACSGAALSATNYFDQSIPFVSFAATHESLSQRGSFPNFFRTVYGDRHQTLAMQAAMEKLDMWNVTILCTKDYYSLSLASSIQQAVIERVSTMKVLEVGETSLINGDQVKEVLSGLRPTDFIILVVPPAVAEGIWSAAAQVGKTSYPWWYFGTDGVTAFDPYVDGSSSNLTEALQGEIGLTPYGGNFNGNPQCQKFYDYWREKAYPGLPLMGVNKSRSYVTHLIDTVTIYFEIVDALVNASVPVNSSSVLSALNGTGIGSPNFTGCTGNVQIDPQTGSRRISSDQPAIYDLVSLVNSSWELKGRIQNATFVSMQPIIRTMPAAEDLHGASNNINGGIIVGWVLFSMALALLVGIIFMYYRNRKSKSRTFFRITR